jgi:hypothetical protein
MARVRVPLLAVLVASAAAGCAPDPLVAAADPLAVLRRSDRVLEAPELVRGEAAVLSVGGLDPGTRCGFFASAAEPAPAPVEADLSRAAPLGTGVAGEDGVARFVLDVGADERQRPIHLQAACVVGTEIYRTRSALRRVGAPPAGTAQAGIGLGGR